MNAGRVGGRGGTAPPAAPAGGFVPPPYPYDRVAELGRLAEALPGGVVDCSIGTPCDAPPRPVVEAMALSGAERGYPSSVGSQSFRRAAADWLARRFEVTVHPDEVVACVGTKEMVASTAAYLRLRHPERDRVLYPALSYPTYAMGATLAGCRPVPVPPATADGRGMDLGSVAPEDVEGALLVWANSPSNPTGGLSDLEAVAAWGRGHGVPVFSDECYVEFTWEGLPRSILQSGHDGVVAVHSLSKRSNLAGLRAGFFVGDHELVGYLGEVRRHAGLMTPGPIQAAAAVALGDDEHVANQRRRYLERLSFMAEQLSAAGCPAVVPQGGFYLWVAVPDRFEDAWAFSEELARTGGLLVAPGDLYGEPPGPGGHVRLAVVQPMVRLRLVAERLDAAGWRRRP